MKRIERERRFLVADCQHFDVDGKQQIDDDRCTAFLVKYLHTHFLIVEKVKERERKYIEMII